MNNKTIVASQYTVAWGMHEREYKRIQPGSAGCVPCHVTWRKYICNTGGMHATGWEPLEYTFPKKPRLISIIQYVGHLK